MSFPPTSTPSSTTGDRPERAGTLIVGAGVLGTAIADELARAGRKNIVLVEREHPGHDTAASGDTTRILRSGYGPSIDYTRRAWKALTDWQALQERTNTSLMVDSGALWLATGDGTFEDNTYQTLIDCNIPVQRLTPEQVADLFPSIAIDDVRFGIYEPEAKVLYARQCVETLSASAAAQGVRIIKGEAHPSGDQVLIDGEPFEADEVIWAAGAWLPGMFPEIIDCTVTQQDVVFVQANDPSWGLEHVPAWIDPSGMRYGIGAENGRLKIASSKPGPEFDPSLPRADVDTEVLDSALHYANHRFPGLSPNQVAGVRACQYSSTADTQFILTAHPHIPGWWLVGGDSGHAFKHSLWIAEYVHSLLDGAHPDPAFGLGPRNSARGLRVSSN